jgi:hypothetical protein
MSEGTIAAFTDSGTHSFEIEFSAILSDGGNNK